MRLFIFPILFLICGCAGLSHQSKISDWSKPTFNTFCLNKMDFSKSIFDDKHSSERLVDQALKDQKAELIYKCTDEQLKKYPLVNVVVEESRTGGPLDSYASASSVATGVTLGVIPAFRDDIVEVAINDTDTGTMYLVTDYSIRSVTSWLLLPVYAVSRPLVPKDKEWDVAVISMPNMNWNAKGSDFIPNLFQLLIPVPIRKR